MMVAFRSNLFDASSSKRDDSFYGVDLAKWLQGLLPTWQTSVVGEDWGWAVLARKGPYKYMFGVYDHDTCDVTDAGALWIIRVYNRRDRRSWFRDLFKYTPPKAHDEVMNELLNALRQAPGVADVRAEALA